MKTLDKINRKLTLITGILMGLLVLNSTLAIAATEGKLTDDKSSASEVAIVEAEVLEQMEEEKNLLAEIKAFNEPMIKIFDANDELIYQAAVNSKEDINDQQLLTLIHKSDFLMSFENTSYYKLHN